MLFLVYIKGVNMVLMLPCKTVPRQQKHYLKNLLTNKMSFLSVNLIVSLKFNKAINIIC
jgi:hypothetical protein